MSECDAWLITAQNDFKFACGMKEFVELQQNPELTLVPGNPGQCNRLMNWRDHWLPVLKAGHLLTPEPVAPQDTQDMQETQELIGVLCYQQQPSAPLEHGGITLHRVPEKITVSEDSACNLSQELKSLEVIVLSCFTYQERCIPIFDLSLLFTLPIDSYSANVISAVNYSAPL